MSNYKKSIASNGQTLYYSAGALIKRGGKYLLIDRVNPPFGLAGLAGHIDEGELPEQTIIREVKEESGLKVISKKLLFEEEILWNHCKTNPAHYAHYWYLFDCEVEGEIHQNIDEAKSINWYNEKELASLNLEPVWRYWFEKLGIIK